MCLFILHFFINLEIEKYNRRKEFQCAPTQVPNIAHSWQPRPPHRRLVLSLGTCGVNQAHRSKVCLCEGTHIILRRRGKKGKQQQHVFLGGDKTTIRNSYICHVRLSICLISTFCHRFRSRNDATFRIVTVPDDGKHNLQILAIEHVDAPQISFNNVQKFAYLATVISEWDNISAPNARVTNQNACIVLMSAIELCWNCSWRIIKYLWIRTFAEHTRLF